MKTLESNRPPRRRVRIAIALIYFAGIASIVGWSLPDGGAASHRVESAMRLQDTGISDRSDVPAIPALATRRTRSGVYCSGCGVVESMRRIDTHDDPMGECKAGEFVRPRAGGTFFFGGGRRDAVEALADIVAAGVAVETSARKGTSTTRHQIVVRFRDGSKHVFDEPAPRTVRVGDRITVIVAAPRDND